MTYKFSLEEYPVLSKEEEKNYFYEYNNATNETEKQDAIDALVYHNMGLVFSCINKMNFSNSTCKADDLVSYGVEALMIAINKYDANSEARFSTYAYNWVWKKVIEGYRVNTKMISVPDYVWEGLIQFSKAMENFKKDNGEKASYLPFSDENNGIMSDMERIMTCNNEKPVSLSTYKNIVSAYQNGQLKSLDEKADDSADKETPLVDMIADKKANSANNISIIMQEEFAKLYSEKKGAEIVKVLELKLEGLKSSEIQRKLGLTRSKEVGLEKKGMEFLQNSKVLREVWLCL